jgi:spore coat protein U-like protein
MPLRCRHALTAVLLAGWAAPAMAACSVEAEPVAFGVIDPQRQSRGTGEVVVRCDEAATFSVGLSAGGSGGDTRRMQGRGGSRLDYYLFADPGYSISWGDGEALGNPVKGAADGARPARLTIYGIVPAQSRTDAGEYEDGLQVTLSF